MYNTKYYARSNYERIHFTEFWRKLKVLQDRLRSIIYERY